MLEHLTRQGVTDRIALVLVDRGVTAAPRAHSTTSASGWLQVACIATTLRHPSRERARLRPAALAA